LIIFTIATKGQSANLLQKGSKRRRTKRQIEAEKEAAMQEEMQKQAKLAQFDVLQAKVQEMENVNVDGAAAISLLD
jgi:hypothetical protein